MRPQHDLLITNADLSSGPCMDILIRNGRIIDIAPELAAEVPTFDAGGCAVLPGLHDRHIHLLASAAQMNSVDLSVAGTVADIAEKFATARRMTGPTSWIRATGWDAAAFSEVDLCFLDAIVPDRPLRIQDATGALWQMNSCALDHLSRDDLPDGFERGTSGELTGRVWREDGWIARHVPASPPDLSLPGQLLARFGVTAITDTSASQTDEGAELLAAAWRRGDLPQDLILMSARPLRPASDGAFIIGAVKILIDERNLPDIDTFIHWIEEARMQARNVAVHCVTDAELALTLAAFTIASTRPGDRIEHGSIIPQEAIETIRQLGLTIVTQPALIHARGTRYLQRIDPDRHGDLYRCASLIDAGISVHGSSDSPYGPIDPWQGMRAARDRLTSEGQSLGVNERLSGPAALRLWLGPPIRHGARANLCMLDRPFDEAARVLSSEMVRATMIGGRFVFSTFPVPGGVT